MKVDKAKVLTLYSIVRVGLSQSGECLGVLPYYLDVMLILRSVDHSKLMLFDLYHHLR